MMGSGTEPSANRLINQFTGLIKRGWLVARWAMTMTMTMSNRAHAAGTSLLGCCAALIKRGRRCSLSTLILGRPGRSAPVVIKAALHWWALISFSGGISR
jgi:hypothetical protein